MVAIVARGGLGESFVSELCQEARRYGRGTCRRGRSHSRGRLGCRGRRWAGPSYATATTATGVTTTTIAWWDGATMDSRATTVVTVTTAARYIGRSRAAGSERTAQYLTTASLALLRFVVWREAKSRKTSQQPDKTARQTPKKDGELDGIWWVEGGVVEWRGGKEIGLMWLSGGCGRGMTNEPPPTKLGTVGRYLTVDRYSDGTCPDVQLPNPGQLPLARTAPSPSL